MITSGQTINSFVTQLLGNTLKEVLTSLRLPWQQVSSTKKTSTYRFIALLERTLNSSTSLEILQNVNLVDFVLFQKGIFSPTNISTG